MGRVRTHCNSTMLTVAVAVAAFFLFVFYGKREPGDRGWGRASAFCAASAFCVVVQCGA